MQILKLVLILDKCMNMKTKYVIMILLGWLLLGSACSESDLTSEFTYSGPIPTIADGPSVAQKICYELYQKYDHHVYYTLSGDDALRTDVGITQTSMIEYNHPNALPLVAADEKTAESFLRLLQIFYNALPETIVKTTVIKRQVLIKENIWFDDLGEYMGYFGMMVPTPNLSIGYIEEAQQGIIYWGEMNDAIGIQPELWKYSLASSFFKTRTTSYYTLDMPSPDAFIQVSKGKYFNEMSYEEQGDAMMEMLDWMTGEWDMDYVRSLGFVDPYAFFMLQSDYMPNEDMATYAAWIVCNPLVERQEILNDYPLVKKRYDLTLEYYKENLNVDLEEFCEFWVNVTIE